MEAAMRLVILTTLLPLALQGEAGETFSACSCAVFSVPGTEPIMERTLQYNVSCDQEGTDKCQQLCIALAESARDKVPTLICEKLDTHIENMMIALYTKSCNMALWTFTGLEGREPVCCHEGKAIACDGTMSTIKN